MERYNFRPLFQDVCGLQQESVWSLDLADGLVIVACNTGKIEVSRDLV